MTGNAAHAALAATHPDEFLFSDFGCSRIVYLIDGVIYKVQRNPFYRDNEFEFAAGQALSGNLPEGYAIPEMEMFGNVLAMAYIDGEPTGECTDIQLGLPCSHAGSNEECIPADILDRINGWDDPAYGNALIEYETGITYLIDLG